MTYPFWSCVLAAAWTGIALYAVSVLAGLYWFAKWIKIHKCRFEHLENMESKHSRLEAEVHDLRYQLTLRDERLKRKGKRNAT